MEDLTLALITTSAFAMLFLVAIFADKAGASRELPEIEQLTLEPVSHNPRPAPSERAA